MDRRPIAVALALAVVISVLVGLVGASHASATTPTARPMAAVHPAAVDSVHATNCYYGGFQPDWYVSQGNNHVCFYAYDPVDNQSIVSVFDQNATRDGLSTPAMQFTVNTSMGANWSYLWPNDYYVLPLSLQDGGWWNLSISGTSGGVFNSSFFVHTYEVSLSENAAVYLPHHTAQIFYDVYRTVNFAPVSSLTTVQANGVYLSGNGSYVSIFAATMNLPNTAVGSFNVTVPTDIATGGQIYVQVWANISFGATSFNNTETVTISVDPGNLGPIGTSVQGCFSGCGGLGGGYPAGSLLELTVSVDINSPYGGGAPASGLTVHLSFFANHVAVGTVPGNPPLTGTTDSMGQFSVVFLANASIFSTQKPNSITVNVSDPLDAQTAAQVNATFNVNVAEPATADISVTTPLSQYYSGDTVTATWAIGAPPSGSTNGWTADSWGVDDLANGGTLANVPITGTATSGTFSYMVGVHYTGQIEVWVEAHNATAWIYGYVDLIIIQPQILLTPNEGSYNPGDHLTVTVATAGSALQGATLFGTVGGYSPGSGDSQYFSGPVTNGQLTLAIPMVSPPTQVTFTVFAQTATDGVLAQNAITVQLAYGLEMIAGITTVSQYTDGSFQPGQTIQVHYQITSVNQAPMPKSFSFEVLFALGVLGATNSQTFQTTQTSGSFSLTVPSSANSGAQFVEIFATGSNCGTEFVSTPCSASAIFGVLVNANPSALTYQVGGSSGLTVGWIVLLVLILVVGFFVWRIARRGRGRTVVMAPESGSTASASPPGATGGAAPSYSESPTAPPSGAWQESSSGSPSDAPAGSPPLPRPPNQN